MAITAISLLLQLVALNDRLITIDAMGGQRAICAQIMAQCGDYLIALKDNQGMPHKDVTAYFANKTTLKNSLISAADIAWRQQEHKWPGLNSIGMVATTVWQKDKMIAEQRCYISSLPANARQLNHAASVHWSIENQLHWRLAVVFNEDGAGVRYDNAAENRNIWRKWALNALQQVDRKPGQSTQSLMRKVQCPASIYKEFTRKYFMRRPWIWLIYAGHVRSKRLK